MKQFDNQHAIRARRLVLPGVFLAIGAGLGGCQSASVAPSSPAAAQSSLPPASHPDVPQNGSAGASGGPGMGAPGAGAP